MAAVLGPFLNAVLAAIVLILATGAAMIGQEAAQASQSGGAFFMPRAWTLMAAGGIVMTAIYAYIRLVPFRAWPPPWRPPIGRRAGATWPLIRRWVGVNLLLGLAVVAAVFLA